MIQSSDYKAWFDEGMALHDSEKPEAALACFQKAIEIQPDFIPAWVYQGMVLEQLQRYEEAIASYDQAIQINPNVADLWYNKGATLCKLRRYPEALVCFDKVLEIDPNNAIAQTTRALTLATPLIPIKSPKRTDSSENGAKPNSAEAENSIELRISRQGQAYSSETTQIEFM